MSAFQPHGKSLNVSSYHRVSPFDGLAVGLDEGFCVGDLKVGWFVGADELGEFVSGLREG